MTTGIIPAYAGNTHGHIIGGVNRGDHPRVCGEHSCTLVQAQCGAGSSPRMRGTLGGNGLECNMFGIIPAYAGNTCRIGR